LGKELVEMQLELAPFVAVDTELVSFAFAGSVVFAAG
jgi:hypothetical protein